MNDGKKKFLVSAGVAAVIVAALVFFGPPMFAPTDPEDAAMKVRRPVPAARRAPGQINAGQSVGPPSAGGDPAVDDEADGGEDDSP